MKQNNSKILIIDFGSQLTQLIARRVRELNVYSEIHSFDLSLDFVQKFNPQGIILSGGPSSVYEDDAPQIPDFIFELNIPILGICYGMQAMAKQLGGVVSNSNTREFGYAEINNTKTEIFKDIVDGNNEHGKYMQVWMSHGDKVTSLPNGFEVIATTQSCPIAAMANVKRNLYGLQFHPEVTHTPQGIELFRRFVTTICQITPSWTMPNYMTEQLQSIKDKVGDKHVILGLSGGVDSTVAAVLINKAIGQQLTCIFIDTGLLRLDEANQVMNNYKELFQLNIVKIDASERFYTELAGVTDPEAKRKIIGRLFVEIFQEYASSVKNATFLAQGTIYPDVIESANAKTKKAHNIKSHHNVGGLPDSLKLELLEPLRELFKDEVRKLGITLGISEKLVYRHPFPGPGLGVRILGEVKPEFVKLLQKADSIFIEELYSNNLYHKVSQAFVVFIPVKTVGVMGDGRTYDYLVSLRSVDTTDFMSATVSNIPFEVLTKVANRIINEVKGINRVTYDISGKPPSTIEWE